MNVRLPFIAAPVLVFAYGLIRIVDGFDGERGPGLAWTVGHLAFILAMVMFLLVFRHLHRLAGRDTLATVTRVVATPVAALVSVTTAPGNAPWRLSATVPCTRAR